MIITDWTTDLDSPRTYQTVIEENVEQTQKKKKNENKIPE